MKVGDRFASFNDMQSWMKKFLGKAFPQMGAYISKLPGHPDVCCAKHVFYNAEFPLKERWNEFEGLSKATVAANWDDVQWLKSKAIEVIHEILSPLVNSAKPGARVDGRYELVIGPCDGQFRRGYDTPCFRKFPEFGRASGKQLCVSRGVQT